MDPGPIGAHDDGELSELKALDKSYAEPLETAGTQPAAAQKPHDLASVAASGI